jgi:hypothetical protein
MKKSNQSPWATGPGEILRHGLGLLRADSDTNRRLAMISIDNAVELMVKTYLGLPKRVTGLQITRREYQEAAESFPALLDALEKHSPAKLDGIDLGTIEWYHRLRNELYHQGNGLTVERDKVEIYAELANVLFRNLFGEELMEHRSARTELLGQFLAAWVELERGLRELAGTHSLLGTVPRGMLDAMRELQGTGILESREITELNELRKTRNEISHGHGKWEHSLSPEIVQRVKYYAKRFSKDDNAA